MTGPELGFAEALERLTSLLKHQGWPNRVAFLPEANVLTTPPHRAFLFRPPAPGAIEAGREAYEIAQREGIAAELHGIGYDGGTCFAYVRVIREPAQGEHMFIERGLKVSVATPPHTIVTVRFRFLWRLYVWAEARRMRLVLHALARPA